MKKSFWIIKLVIASKIIVAILLAQFFVSMAKINSAPNSYVITNLSAFKRVIGHVSLDNISINDTEINDTEFDADEVEILAAALVYNSEKIDSKELQKITKSFVRAARDHRLKKYVDFIRLDINKFADLNKEELKKVGLKQADLSEPVIILYYNGEPTGDFLTGKRLTKTQQIANFIETNLHKDIEYLKKIDQPVIHRTTRYYDDSPSSYYSGAYYYNDFGSPFSYNYYGAYPYQHPYYHYPYYGYYNRPSAGFYFGW